MIFAFLFLPLFSIAGVIQDDVATTDKFRFSFKTVCEKMVTHEAPLIDAISGTELDCMGKKIEVGNFCDKELAADPYYLRAFIDKEKREVVCHSGKKVLFKYLCVKLSDKDLCNKEAKVSCTTIQKKLAKRLDMVHFSFTKNEKGIKQLNCYFESLPLVEKR
jgi:hypothetical protein